MGRRKTRWVGIACMAAASLAFPMAAHGTRPYTSNDRLVDRPDMIDANAYTAGDRLVDRPDMIDAGAYTAGDRLVDRPDMIDANAYTSGDRLVDRPDMIDAGAHGAPTLKRATIVVRESPAFDWTDAGIGAAGGFAVALLLGGVVVLTRRGSEGKLAL